MKKKDDWETLFWCLIGMIAAGAGGFAWGWIARGSML